MISQRFPEEWAGAAFSSIQSQISSEALEVVHYHKEVVETGYRELMSQNLSAINSDMDATSFDYGHLVTRHGKPDNQDAAKETLFPSPNAKNAQV